MFVSFFKKKKRKMPLSGLYIGNNWIRYISLGWEGGYLAVQKVCKKTIPRENLLFKTFDDWVTRIKEIKNEMGIPHNSLLNCALPIRETYFETLKFPIMQRNELEKSIRWECQRRLKKKWEDLCFDSYCYKEQEDSSESLLLVALTSRKTVSKFLKILKRCKLGASCLEPPQLALLRGLQGPYQDDYLPLSVFCPKGNNVIKIYISPEGIISSELIDFDEEGLLADENPYYSFPENPHWFWVSHAVKDKKAILKTFSTNMRELPPLQNMWSLDDKGQSIVGYEIALGLALRDFLCTSN